MHAYSDHTQPTLIPRLEVEDTHFFKGHILPLTLLGFNQRQTYKG